MKPLGFGRSSQTLMKLGFYIRLRAEEAYPNVREARFLPTHPPAIDKRDNLPTGMLLNQHITWLGGAEHTKLFGIIRLLLPLFLRN